MFYLIDAGYAGYLDYSDNKVYTYAEASYSRARDLKRGHLRASQALADGRYEIGTHLDSEGLYRFQIKTNGGLTLCSKKQYNTIDSATKAGYKWRPASDKVKRIKY